MSTLVAIPTETAGTMEFQADELPEVTPEELLAMPDGDDYELVDGVPVERTMCLLASRVELSLGRTLDTYCASHELGWVVGPPRGYRCFSWKPRQVRRPDLSFIAQARLPSEAHWSKGYLAIPPDLAVEVTSPTDVVYELEQKVEESIRAGVRLIWVIHPEVQAIQVIRADGSGTRIRSGNELSGEDVVPGFRCPVASLFPATLASTPGARETASEPSAHQEAVKASIPDDELRMADGCKS